MVQLRLSVLYPTIDWDGIATKGTQYRMAHGQLPNSLTEEEIVHITKQTWGANIHQGCQPCPCTLKEN